MIFCKMSKKNILIDIKLFSYNSCKAKITRHIIVVQRHNKNIDFQKYHKEKFENEFPYLESVTDDDKFHLVRLIEPNDLCRYKDIRPYEDNFVPLKSGKKFHLRFSFYILSNFLYRY